jgi:hypothetical protein
MIPTVNPRAKLPVTIQPTVVVTTIEIIDQVIVL